MVSRYLHATPTTTSCVTIVLRELLVDVTCDVQTKAPLFVVSLWHSRDILQYIHPAWSLKLLHPTSNQGRTFQPNVRYHRERFSFSLRHGSSQLNIKGKAVLENWIINSISRAKLFVAPFLLEKESETLSRRGHHL